MLLFILLLLYIVALGAGTIQYATTARAGAPAGVTLQQVRTMTGAPGSLMQQLAAAAVSQTSSVQLGQPTITGSTSGTTSAATRQLDGLGDSSSDSDDEDDYRDNDDDQDDNDDEMNDDENDGGIEDEVSFCWLLLSTIVHS